MPCILFLEFFRQAFPRFAQMDENRRGFLQQDAGEFLTELLNRIKADGVNGDIIKDLFEFEMERTYSISCKKDFYEFL